MKHKISAVLLAVSLFLMTLAISPGAVRASASVSTEGKLPDISELVNPSVDVSSLIPNKFKLLVTLLNYCKENNIPPDSDKLDNFLMFIYHDIDEYADVDGFRESISATWSLLHTAFHPYMIYLEKFYQMGWGAVSTWINEHYNDTLTGIDDKGNVQIPIDDLKQELEKQNDTIDPKNRSMLKYSWRDLSPNQDNVNLDCFARGVFKEGKSVVDTSLEDGIYIQLYMRRNGSMYYCPYQYKLYCTKEVSVIGADGTAYKHNWYFEPIYYERVDGVTLDTFSSKVFTYSDHINSDGRVVSGHPSYFSLGLGDANATLTLTGFKTLAGCLNHLNSDEVEDENHLKTLTVPAFPDGCSSMFKENYSYLLRSDNVSDKYPFICSGFGTSSERSGLMHFFHRENSGGLYFTNDSIVCHDTGYSDGVFYDSVVTCDEGNTCDFGFLISSEEFSTTYQFDTTRLPVNSTVTISGDSVYDYSITDNSTGETSTIYNYVTNNYTYPPQENTSGGNGNSGGTVGGNVNVGGDVNVGGKVDIGGKVDVGGKVDINVNVNGNGGGNGVSADMPDMNAVDDYLNSALDESTGIRKFLKEFFGFLPSELVVLLGIGLAAAIVARLFGR